jgi:uncharacterized repeat protein (TIGR01451 family)
VLRLTEDTGNQRGSAWFNTSQPVTKAWTSTFQFQITGSDVENHGDGFAFVIQNNGLTSIGGFGGGLGYGTRFTEDPPCTNSGIICSPAGTDLGIPKSLAIEFDTYQNSYDPDDQHIAVQSCGSSPNSPNHYDICNIAIASTAVNLANGTHTIKIDYKPCDGECGPTLFVYLDGATVPVLATFVDIDNTLNLDGTPAFVGFTAATRGAHEAHDILNWTFSPAQTETVTTSTTVFPFQGGPDAGGYNYTAQLAPGSPSVDVQVTPILKTQAECNLLLQPTFPGAQCFVYNNADGLGGHFAVMFEVTCPGSPGSQCGTISDPSFDAVLGSKYVFDKSFNPGYRQNSDQNPLPGWLKGQPVDTDHPCNPNPSNTPALFQSNQIESFAVVGDPTATTKGKSGGTGSCWVATYNTPGVAPSVSVTIPANNANYRQGTSIASSFVCTPVNTLETNPTSPVGPYLSVPATPAPGGCTATIDGETLPTTITSGMAIPTTPGQHTFVATVLDSGSDTKSTQTITYNVVGPTDLAILKVAPAKTAVNSKLTYAIGVGDLGSQSAVGVVVNDILPANTTFVSVSASKVSCSIVNRRLTCSTSTIPCTSGATVSCNVGTLMPLSLSSLNGATIKLTVKLGSPLTAGKTVKNTATVSGTNADSKPGNNSSTASTQVTAH